MILQNVQIIGYDDPQDIRINRSRIKTIISNEVLLNQVKDEKCIVFENAFAFPGLINSHDHLDFNLFPQLSNRIYSNYMEWGPDIHKQNKSIIGSILKIPKQLRFDWGVYKNLLNGITTVVHHGEHLTKKKSLINIFQDCYSLHSVGIEKFWKYKLNNPFINSQPFVIHIGEGTDVASKKEIDKLIKWNIFKRKIIGIHGVAMNKKQASAFEAVIWCPDSNIFLLGSTAAIKELKGETKIIFGTDSTISASWNIWNQIRLAKKTNLLTDKELFDSLTIVPASVWGLNNTGIIAENKNADIVVAKMKDNDAMNSFFLLNPEDILLILRDGHIILFDEMLLTQLDSADVALKSFSKISINNIGKYIQGDLPLLIKELKQYNTGIDFPVEV